MPLSIEITQSAADGKALSVGDLRAFLAECDRVGIPAELRLRGDTSFRGWLRAIAAEQLTEEAAFEAPKTTTKRTSRRTGTGTDGSGSSSGKGSDTGRRQR